MSPEVPVEWFDLIDIAPAERRNTEPSGTERPLPPQVVKCPSQVDSALERLTVTREIQSSHMLRKGQGNGRAREYGSGRMSTPEKPEKGE